MMRFNQPRQGRGPRLPRAGKAALCGYVIGVGLSTFLYPQVRPGLVEPVIESQRHAHARPQPIPIRRREPELNVKVHISEGPEFDAAFVCALEILLNSGRGETQ